MSKKLRVLFIPLGAVGHVNSAIGMARVLMDNGYEAVFYISEQWKGEISKHGAQEILYHATDEDNTSVMDPAEYWANDIRALGMMDDTPPMDKLLLKYTNNPHFDENKQLDEKIDMLIPRVKPHVIIIDQDISLTSVERLGIPWVLVCSTNPLYYLEDDRTPPSHLGMAIDSDQNEWRRLRKVFDEHSRQLHNSWNHYLISRGVPPNKHRYFINHSPYLNFYTFPEELDYTEERPVPSNWYRFDNYKRIEVDIGFEIPEKLRDRPGKLIYFSLGSMGSVNLEVTKRLIRFLGDCPHRFIVSKGPLHQSYGLTDNMWGLKSVPQLEVLPVVDLVITHGGNNTVCETFAFGKPMIVMPLFFDQYDNAQRVQEKGFGLRLDPYRCSKVELLEAIDRLLNDYVLIDKMKNISQKIISENRISKLPKLIDDLVNIGK